MKFVATGRPPSLRWDDEYEEIRAGLSCWKWGMGMTSPWVMGISQWAMGIIWDDNDDMPMGQISRFTVESTVLRLLPGSRGAEAAGFV